MKTPEERSKANEARGQCASCSPIIARRCRTLRTVEECLDYIDTLEGRLARLNGERGCVGCKIEAEIGGPENPHPVPERFHACGFAPPAPSASPRRCAGCDQLVLECMGSTLPRDFVAAIDGRVSAQLIRELCASCAERLGPSMVAGTDSLGEFSGPVRTSVEPAIRNSIAEHAKRMVDHILANRERYLAAWLAETACPPSEAQLVEQRNADGSVTVRVERIVSRAEPASTGRERLGRWLAAKTGRCLVACKPWRGSVWVTIRDECDTLANAIRSTEDEAIAAALDQLTAAESAGKAET